jgi:hypothetical protein
MNKPAKKPAIQFSESEIDKLIADVDATLTKAEALAKSALKKDDVPPQDDDQQDQPPAAPAAPAPGPDAPPVDAAPAAPADGAPAAPEAPPQEGQPQGEQAIGQEGQEDAPLSDDELQEIYSSMPPEELERHYGVIRQILQSAYASQAPAPAAPGQEAQPPAAPAAPGGAPAAPEAPSQDEPEFGKSEEMSALRKQVEDQGKALEAVTKAFEILAKPQRKSVTDIQFISKSDIDPANQPKELSKEEIQSWVKKTGPAALNKSDRETISNYFLSGSGKKDVEKIINSKGETK